MKIPVFSDLHAHNYEQFATKLPNGRNSRLQDCINVVSQIADYACENHCKLTMFLGDAMHARSTLNVDVITATVEAFRSMSDDTQVMMLVGNHDQYTRVGNVHSTYLFSDSSIKVVDNYYRFQIEDVKIACTPYQSDVPGLIEWLNKSSSDADILFMHQGISEAAVGPFDMHVKTEISLKDIPLDKYKLVVAGDYHKRQFLAGGKFHYVGSPLQLSFGERTEAKGFSVIDTEDWSVQFVETLAPKFYVCDSEEELAQYLSSGHIRQDIDFYKIETSDPNFDAHKVRTKYPRAQIVHHSPETQLRKRESTANLDDSQLLDKWVTDQGSWQEAFDLVQVGRECLMGANDED